MLTLIGQYGFKKSSVKEVGLGLGSCFRETILCGLVKIHNLVKWLIIERGSKIVCLLS